MELKAVNSEEIRLKTVVMCFSDGAMYDFTVTDEEWNASDWDHPEIITFVAMEPNGLNRRIAAFRANLNYIEAIDFVREPDVQVVAP